MTTTTATAPGQGAATRRPPVGWTVRSVRMPDPTAHPVLRALMTAQWALFLAEATPTWTLGQHETAVAVQLGDVVTAQLAGTRLRVLAHADHLQVGAPTGATSTAAHLAAATRATRAAAHRDVTLAAALSGEHADLGAALTQARVNLDQTRTIHRALEALPTDLDPTLRAQARTELIRLAQAHDAKDLAVLGSRILEVLAPEIAEAIQAKNLADAEAAAEKKKHLTLTDDTHGSTHGRFTIPTHLGDILRKHLHALTSPARHTTPVITGGTGDTSQTGAEARRRTTPERLGEALAEYIERYPSHATPTAGGVAATIVITIDLATLMGGLGVATLDSGTRITAAHARRLACTAGLVPAVLDTQSHPLDLGRTTRLFTTAQHLALAIRDRGCTAQGCDRPATWCEAHHEDPWATGGHTNLDRGRLLCRHHHQLIHRPDHHTIHLEPHRPGGPIRFIRRTRGSP